MLSLYLAVGGEQGSCRAWRTGWRRWGRCLPSGSRTGGPARCTAHCYWWTPADTQTHRELMYRQKAWNWRIDKALARPPEMMFGSTKWGKLLNTITNHIIKANQKSESFVYRWQRAHAVFDVTCFSAFVGVSNVILSILTNVGRHNMSNDLVFSWA